MIQVLANTKLHFSDDQFNVIDISEKSLVDNLNKLEKTDFKTTKGLIVFAEAKTKGEYHQNYKGLELLKHTLLNQEKQYFKLPILLVHLANLNYVLRHNKDNMMLLAPNITTIGLEDFSELSVDEVIKKYFHQKPTNGISHKEFSNYILIDSTDESATHHDEINAAGAERMLKEWDGRYSITKEPLHYKKYFFKYKIKMTALPKEDIHEFNLCRDAIQKVLFIDDEADKWEGCLNYILAGKLEVVADFKTAKTKLKTIGDKLAKQSIKLKKNKLEDATNCFSINLKEKPLHPSGSYRNLNVIDHDIVKECQDLWSFDAVILDLRDSSSSEYQGKTLIKKIKAINPITPIIIFSATKNTEIMRELKTLGATCFFEKGKQSVKDLMNIFWAIDYTSNKTISNIWWKLYTVEKYIREAKHNSVFFNFNIKNDAVLEYTKINMGYSKGKGDIQESIRLVLLSIKNILPKLSKQAQVLKRAHSLKEPEVLSALMALYPFFSASEIRFNTLPTESEINQRHKQPFINFNESILIKKERAFRKLRNSLYHPEMEVKHADLQSFDIIEEIKFFTDWLINPMQIDIVQSFVKDITKVYGIKHIS